MLNIIIILALAVQSVLGFELSLECDNTIVLGAKTNCTVQVNVNGAQFNYEWRDDAIPRHTRSVRGNSSDSFTITYAAPNNNVGYYNVRVEVCRYATIFCWGDTSIGTSIVVTDTLNGNMTITQQKTEMDNAYVATKSDANYSISLTRPDLDYLKNATTIQSFWFVDCVYYGIHDGLSFIHNFTEPEKVHRIETLVVGDFTPPKPPPTTTTTTTTTSTTPKPHNKVKREANNTSNIKEWKDGVLVPSNLTFPYVCNSTMVPTNPQQVNGYFYREVTTKDAVSNINVSGNNWLQHGALLSLQVQCSGSGTLQFCYSFVPGRYNVTGNETCAQYTELDKCSFPIQRYFQDEHTVVIIIKNDVNKQVTSVAVTVYKVKHQAQLSVIVVPVVFTLVAVVTIVFGAAYYVQNRHRFIVEVADFDFAPRYMEYKTFKDRLKDSIINAFGKDSAEADGSGWGTAHQYGSMK